MSSLPDYKSTFPQWSSQDLGRIVDTLDEVAMDFLNVRALTLHNFYLYVIRRVTDFFFCSVLWSTTQPRGFLVCRFLLQAWRSLSFLKRNAHCNTLISRITSLHLHSGTLVTRLTTVLCAASPSSGYPFVFPHKSKIHHHIYLPPFHKYPRGRDFFFLPHFSFSCPIDSLKQLVQL